MRVFVVAGSPEASPPSGLAPQPGDRVIAADRGALHARRWGWPVHLLVGDMDSLPQAEAAALAAAETPTLTAPRAKDETDIELALAQALQGPAGEQAPEIVICAAIGGRTDHMLANILLLVRPELADRRVLIAAGRETVQILRGKGVPGPAPAGERASLTLAGAPSDLLSLLPVGGDAEGVSTDGLVYPLYDETLFFGHARGVSNEFAAAMARVWLRAGLLLVIHTRSGDD